MNNSDKDWLDDDDQAWYELIGQVEKDKQKELSSPKSRFSFLSHKKNEAFDSHQEEDSRKVEVNIKLSLPKVNVSRFKKFKLYGRQELVPLMEVKRFVLNKKFAVPSATLILILAVIVVGNIYFFHDKPQETQQVAGASSALDVPEPTNNPEFPIVKPEGRELPQDRVVYDPKRKFAKYNDEINGIPITVSQQKMPAMHESDPNGGASKIAKDFGATEVFNFDGVEMHYGQDEKGPQTVILTKNGLLIFIATSQFVDKEGLKVYAGNLN